MTLRVACIPAVWHISVSRRAWMVLKHILYICAEENVLVLLLYWKVVSCINAWSWDFVLHKDCYCCSQTCHFIHITLNCFHNLFLFCLFLFVFFVCCFYFSPGDPFNTSKSRTFIIEGTKYPQYEAWPYLPLEAFYGWWICIPSFWKP